jgi:Domain of unknown function (DUF1905)
MLDLSFSFVGKCWLWHGGKAAWHFITLPEDKSEEIKYFNENMHEKRRGWGAVRVQATIGNTSWETSIFPSSELKAYILPVKADVRKNEKITVGNDVKISLQIKV